MRLHVLYGERCEVQSTLGAAILPKSQYPHGVLKSRYKCLYSSEPLFTQGHAFIALKSDLRRSPISHQIAIYLVVCFE